MYNELRNKETALSRQEDKDMKTNTRTTTVEGKTYTVWGDFIARGTFAENEAGEAKQISYGGYVHNDLTVRKAIARTFGHKTFRK